MKLYRSEDYRDERGVIMNATPMNPTLKNVMYITGVKGAVRGNHVHKYDTHYCLVVAGKIKFEYTEPGDDKIFDLELNPGDVVLSEVGEKHRFTFLEDGAFVAMATAERTHEIYEHDTTRIEF